ncbi:hypothetical protein LZ30DRAFT_729307 [Colletotrichum cereale]|nr:hypothetical protein LZ30DRAFT_729307 [Colletotrichum cereale]
MSVSHHSALPPGQSALLYRSSGGTQDFVFCLPCSAAGSCQSIGNRPDLALGTLFVPPFPASPSTPEAYLQTRPTATRSDPRYIPLAQPVSRVIPVEQLENIKHDFPLPPSFSNVETLLAYFPRVF